MYEKGEKGARLNLSDHVNDMDLKNLTFAMLYQATGHDKNDMIVR